MDAGGASKSGDGGREKSFFKLAMSWQQKDPT
jgi:hypothetical protein